MLNKETKMNFKRVKQDTFKWVNEDIFKWVNKNIFKRISKDSTSKQRYILNE